MRIRTILTAAAAPAALAAVLFGTAASASASTTAPGSYPGFVGKGDVQTVFGLNDKALQTDANAGAIGFVHETTTDTSYQIGCNWETPQGGKHGIITWNPHHRTMSDSRVSGVAVGVNNQPRHNPNDKVNGFNLTGEDPATVTQSGDDVPQVGQPCVDHDPNSGIGDNAVIESVTPTSSTTTDVLRVSDAAPGRALAPTALDGYNVWHLTDGSNPVVGSVNTGTTNGSVY